MKNETNNKITVALRGRRIAVELGDVKSAHQMFWRIVQLLIGDNSDNVKPTTVPQPTATPRD